MVGSEKVIKVDRISKCYNIGQREPYKTISGSIGNIFKKSYYENKLALQKAQFWALKNISFDVEEGNVFGIIGRNGAGKSTLLKIISRITFPTTGHIKVKGRVGSLLEVGTGFHPELTGRENIFLSGSILGMKRDEIENDFDQIVRFSEIEKFLDTPVKRYSSGMYVRLAFSVAAHLNSDILLVDEVLAVGDTQFQKKCMGKMRNVTNEGRTVLFVSHNVGIISNLCHLGLLLKEGNVDTIGEISDVVHRYISDHETVDKEVTWDKNSSPGDSYIRLKSIRITVDGKLCSNIPINKDLYIEISYWNLVDNSSILTSIHLLDKNGYPVFASGNGKEAMLNEDKWSEPDVLYPTGLFKTTIKIPQNFLNEGLYYVSVFILTDLTNMHVKKDEVISFNIVDTGEMRGNFGGGWLGIIRPKFEWYTDLLEDEK